jgi:hypothetical protein
MKSKSHFPLDSIFKVMVLLVYGVTPASAQAPDKVVSWSEYPMGRITQVAPNMRLSPIEESLEIVDILVDGKSIAVGEPFTASENWIRNFTVRVRNISGQEIHSIEMSIVLPDVTLSDGRNYGLSLRGGSTPAGKQKPVMPGEEVGLKWIEIEYQKFKERSAQLNGVAHIMKAQIGMTAVLFTDGTMWGSDCLRATDSRNSCHRGYEGK